ncbi:hypothetical protein SASPL_141988 [Salvia splendens]|uniref:Uncharacterized protein n=1 Tax=Salvia splendens TaxID=180675 RepID=A0A8X8WJ03_SALSN|nr:hypothetical protein SASPL_141988 [Salvia splendens]
MLFEMAITYMEYNKFVWIQVPRNRYWGLRPPPAPLENVINDGLKAIQRALFLKKAGADSSVDDEFLLHPPTRADLLESAIENMIRKLENFEAAENYYAEIGKPDAYIQSVIFLSSYSLNAEIPCSKPLSGSPQSWRNARSFENAREIITGYTQMMPLFVTSATVIKASPLPSAVAISRAISYSSPDGWSPDEMLNI